MGLAIQGKKILARLYPFMKNYSQSCALISCKRHSENLTVKTSYFVSAHRETHLLLLLNLLLLTPLGFSIIHLVA